jgi:hypothetical protein
MSTVIGEGKLRFTQDADCCAAGDQLLEVEAVDGGAGCYVVLSTERWAIDREELPKLVAAIGKLLDSVETFAPPYEPSRDVAAPAAADEPPGFYLETRPLGSGPLEAAWDGSHPPQPTPEAASDLMREFRPEIDLQFVITEKPGGRVVDSGTRPGRPFQLQVFDDVNGCWSAMGAPAIDVDHALVATLGQRYCRDFRVVNLVQNTLVATAYRLGPLTYA